MFVVTGVRPDDPTQLLALRADTYAKASTAAQTAETNGWVNVEIGPDDTPAAREKSATAAVRAVFSPAAAERITQDDAFGALVYLLAESCRFSGVTPEATLRLLSDNQLWFAGEEAASPASYLAARVRDL